MKYFPLLALTLLAAPAYAEDHTTLLTTSKTIANQPIVVPENAKLVMSEIIIAPGEALPMHKHPYPRFAYVKEGAVDVTLDEPRKTIHFRTGEAFAETIGGWHFGKNNGTMPVKIIVVDQIPQDVENNTVMAVVK